LPKLLATARPFSRRGNVRIDPTLDEPSADDQMRKATEKGKPRETGGRKATGLQPSRDGNDSRAAEVRLIEPSGSAAAH
jgi:hypothetical protein